MLLYHLRTLLMLAVMLLALVQYLRTAAPRPPGIKLLGLLTAIALVVEVGGYLTTLRLWNNSVLYNVFITTEFCILLQALERQLPRLRKTFRAIGLLGIAALAAVLIGRRGDLWSALLSENIALFALLLAVAAALALWHVANTSSVPVQRVPLFWIGMGLLLYFGALSPVVILAQVVRSADPLMAAMLWTIMPVLCALRYLLTTYGFHLQATTQHPLR
ncbi:MAG: hypothetical protein JNM62_05400 [Flavobacteriales bacterium]|nr:hypothetical protein [Flavobacteriales bacterium]